MTSAVESPLEEVETKTQVDGPWRVLVLDDPVNLMEYVTRVLMKIFGYARPKAESLMMEIHTKGRSVVWQGGRERAEMYVQMLHQAQLYATLEGDS